VLTVLTNTAGTLVPHASVTTGVVGATASEAQATVDAPLAGRTGEVVLSIVYVYFQVLTLLEQSVYE
jgi:hypothetical protein